MTKKLYYKVCDFVEGKYRSWCHSSLGEERSIVYKIGELNTKYFKGRTNFPTGTLHTNSFRLTKLVVGKKDVVRLKDGLTLLHKNELHLLKCINGCYFIINIDNYSKKVIDVGVWPNITLNKLNELTKKSFTIND